MRAKRHVATLKRPLTPAPHLPPLGHFLILISLYFLAEKIV